MKTLPVILVWLAAAVLIVVYVNLFRAQTDMPRPIGPQHPQSGLSGEFELRGKLAVP